MRTGQRTGILGGTFDPVHNGHLAIAKEVRHRLKLDNVWFVPAAQPPHKPDYAISPFDNRVAMLQTAITGYPGFNVSRLEAELPGPSYTIDTLRALRRRLGKDIQLFFIIGLDAFAEITTWKEYDRLPREADFVIITRPTHNPKTAQEIIENFFPENDSDINAIESEHDSPKDRFHILTISPIEVSSTEIRQLCRSGKNFSHMVPPKVEDYIRAHNLYTGEQPRC